MLLRKSAGEKKKELAFFRRNLTKAGFISRMKSMLAELLQYGITEEDLARLKNAGSGSPDSGSKAGRSSDLLSRLPGEPRSRRNCGGGACADSTAGAATLGLPEGCGNRPGRLYRLYHNSVRDSRCHADAGIYRRDHAHDPGFGRSVGFLRGAGSFSR